MTQQEGITKGWRREEYKSIYTGNLVQIAIFPENDLEPHDILFEDCRCIPILETTPEGVDIIIHNAFDGRELKEKDERGT